MLGDSVEVTDARAKDMDMPKRGGSVFCDSRLDVLDLERGHEEITRSPVVKKRSVLGRI